jgi:WD40 repeat protein
MEPGPTGRLSRVLVGWHPRRWRQRYGEEMLDVLDQHHPTARTVASLGASAVSAHLDPAWRTERLSLSRLRRAALISAVVAAPLALIVGPVGYGIWQDDHWHPAADEGLLSASFSAHTAILVTAFGQAIDGTDVVWDVTDLSRPRRLSQFEGGQPTALSPDGRTVATVTFSGRTALWNVADPRHPAMVATLPGSDFRHLNPSLRGQAFSPDGRILATAYYNQVFLWDVASPARPWLLRTLAAPVTSAAGSSSEIPFSPQDIAFSPGGTILASATGTDQVTVWNVTDPARAYRLATLGAAGDFTQALAFSPRGNLLAVLTSHGTVLVYNLADPARPARTATVGGLLARARYPDGQTQPDEVLCDGCILASYAVAFSPGGQTLTVVVDRQEMSANSGRDTIFDWHVTSSGTLGAATATARDVADSQPFIAPGDRAVLGSPGGSHAWHTWTLP